MMNTKPLFTAIAASSLLALAACGSETTEDTPNAVSTDTLATVIEDDSELSTVTGILGDTGLQAVFDGNAPYTVFAPTDAAFDQLDLPLDDDDAGAARVAILREHIVPGFLTLEDLVNAVESAGGSVEMQTMGSNTLSFSGNADELFITSSDGSEARVAGAGLSGSNGTVFPIDAVLKSTDAPE